MKSCYYDYSQYLSFYKEVERRAALICDHFQLDYLTFVYGSPGHTQTVTKKSRF